MIDSSGCAWAVQTLYILHMPNWKQLCVQDHLIMHACIHYASLHTHGTVYKDHSCSNQQFLDLHANNCYIKEHAYLIPASPWAGILTMYVTQCGPQNFNNEGIHNIIVQNGSHTYFTNDRHLTWHNIPSKMELLWGAWYAVFEGMKASCFKALCKGFSDSFEGFHSLQKKKA